jgi:hypothetical protein
MLLRIDFVEMHINTICRRKHGDLIDYNIDQEHLYSDQRITQTGPFNSFRLMEICLGFITLYLKTFQMIEYSRVLSNTIDSWLGNEGYDLCKE